MTTYYVGPGGNNANAGTSYASRRLTLTSIETLVAAGDTVYVAPGIYRETLTVTTSGTSGNAITYIGDVTGAYTDNVGGRVRITGSNNDTTATRALCISGNDVLWRTFRFLDFDTATDACIRSANSATGTDWVIEYCSFQGSPNGDIQWVPVRMTVRGCWFFGGATTNTYGLLFSTGLNSSNILVESCVFVGYPFGTLNFDVGTADCVVRNNTFYMHDSGSYACVARSTPAGHSNVAQGNVFYNVTNCFFGDTTDGWLEDYNVGSPSIGRTNTNAGTHSIDQLVLFLPPILTGDGRYNKWNPWEILSVTNLTGGTSVAAKDITGAPIPQGLAGSWGAVTPQTAVARNSVTVDTGDTYSIALQGRSYIDFEVPCLSGVLVTVSCNVAWDNNANIGVKPKLSLLASNGIAQQDASAVGTGAVFESLSVSATPSFDGMLIARVWNLSTFGSVINVYVDDLVST